VTRPLDRFFNKPAAKKKARKRLPVAAAVPRLRILLILVAVVFSVAAGRAVQVQAIDASAVATEATDERTVNLDLPAIRGTISDRNGEPLAYTQDTVLVIANPVMIATNGRMGAGMTAKDKETAATAPTRLAALLAQYLGGSAADYLPKLTASNQYQVVGTKVPAATYRALRQAATDAGLVGLSSKSAPTRSYPNQALAANLIGYVNADGVGGGGLEYALNKSLAGTAGKQSYERASSGEKIPMGNSSIVPAVNGASYSLTIDSGLQWQAEQLLANQVRRMEGDWGGAIVANAKTGEILAMANYPSFDPNEYGKADADSLGNHTITDSYTPGSVQKLLTFAALIDQGLVDPGEVVTVPAKLKSGDNWVQDAWGHGKIKLYARGVVAKSSNIGTIVLARRASKQSLHDYMASFGMGAKTKIGLPGEGAGSLPAANMPGYTRDGMAFGGSATSNTMVQMAAAVGAIANGGVYNPPQILKSRTLPDGTVENLTGAQPHRVVSAETAAQVLSMMESMAENSGSHTFDVPGYRVGAKTGTSQKLDPKTGRTVGLVTSAISVAPIENPQIVVYVVVDSPKKGGFGSVVAGPVVQSLMSLALTRYAVPQSTTKAPHLPIAP
jgi:cell division protein FtsI (penicillin-binding protein 3)